MASVRVFVSDVKKATAFYTKALGFEVAESWGPAISILAKGDLTLWVSGPKTSAAKAWEDGTKPEPGGFTRIVLPLEDWENLQAKIHEFGGRIANGPLEGPGGTQIVVQDPDGNCIEFFS